MNTKEWNKQFKEKHLHSILFDLNFDDYGNECEKKTLKEEGLDYFIIGDDFFHTRYSFDKETVQNIQNMLPSEWFVTNYIEISGNITKTIVEVSNKTDTLSFESFVNENSYPRQKMLELQTIHSENLEDCRYITSLLHSLFFLDTSLSSKSIRQLIPNEELEHLFGEAAKHFDTRIEILDFSQRSYVCLAREKYETVFDIVWDTPQKIENIAQLGRKSCAEIIDKMIELQVPWNIQLKIQQLFE